MTLLIKKKVFLLSELQNLQKENDGKLRLQMDFTAWSTVKLLALAYTIVHPFYTYYSAISSFPYNLEGMGCTCRCTNWLRTRDFETLTSWSLGIVYLKYRKVILDSGLYQIKSELAGCTGHFQNKIIYSWHFPYCPVSNREGRGHKNRFIMGWTTRDQGS